MPKKGESVIVIIVHVDERNFRNCQCQTAQSSAAPTKIKLGRSYYSDIVFVRIGHAAFFYSPVPSEIEEGLTDLPFIQIFLLKFSEIQIN